LEAKLADTEERLNAFTAEHQEVVNMLKEKDFFLEKANTQFEEMERIAKRWKDMYDNLVRRSLWQRIFNIC
jgi:hypothetical protein